MRYDARRRVSEIYRRSRRIRAKITPCALKSVVTLAAAPFSDPFFFFFFAVDDSSTRITSAAGGADVDAFDRDRDERRGRRARGGEVRCCYSGEKIAGRPGSEDANRTLKFLDASRSHAASVSAAATASETASETAPVELDAGGDGDDEFVHVAPSMVIRAAPFRAVGARVAQPAALSPETQHVKSCPIVYSVGGTS